MGRYRITNRATGDRYDDVEAPTAADACARVGWLIGNCYVQPRAEDPTPVMSEEWARHLIDRLRKLPEPRRTLTWEALIRVIEVAEGCTARDAGQDPDQGNQGADEQA